VTYKKLQQYKGVYQTLGLWWCPRRRRSWSGTSNTAATFKPFF